MFSYARHSSGGISRRYPASNTCVTPCAFASASTSSSARSPSSLPLGLGYVSVGMPSRLAHATPPQSGLFETTTATEARTSPRVIASCSARRFEPPPETNTATFAGEEEEEEEDDDDDDSE